MLLITAALALAVPLLGTVYALREAEVAQARAASTTRLVLAQAVARQIEIALIGTTNGVRAIATVPHLAADVRERDAEALRQLLEGIRRRTAFYVGLAVVDASGALLAADRPERAALLASHAGDLSESEVVAAVDRDALVVVRARVVGGDGQVLGAVLGAISLDAVLGATTQSGFGSTGAILIATPEGDVRLGTDPRRVGRRLTAPAILALLARGDPGSERYFSPLMNRREISAVFPIAGRGLAVMVTQAEQEALVSVVVFERYVVPAMAGLLVLGLVLLLLGGRTWRRYEGEMLHVNQLLSAVTEGTNDTVTVKDAHGRYIMVNSAMARFCRRPIEEILGRTVAELFGDAMALAAHERDREAMRAPGPVASEFSQDFEGKRHWYSTVQAAFRDVDGSVAGVIAVTREVTERVLAQELIERQSHDLKRSNTELERFAYVASHDLQEPLRMVSSFMQLLQKRYGGKLDATADEYIGYAVDGAQRLQSMIQGILDLSRVGTRGAPFQDLELGLLLDRALGGLAALVHERGARIERGPMPLVRGDAAQLVRVLQNLIGNALKFCDRESPLVRIASSETDTAWQVSVSDNGIGIAAADQERIFAMMTRLHTREQYPGTGMGLAIVKRIVERHGGKVWVESQPGEGSTFHFTLAKQPPQD